MLLVKDIGELLTCDAADGRPLRGKETSNPGLIKNAAIVIYDGIIVDRGQQDAIIRKYGDRITDEISADGGLVTPGLVDPHTHAVFVGTRELEFEMRIQGKSYMEIAKAGGGILNTAKRVRESNEQELLESGLKYLNWSLKHGTTTIEVKSGYGLSTESELMMLRAIKELGEQSALDVVSTFLGAHEVPAEFRPDRRKEYVDIVVNEMLPKVAKERLAKFVDVFCEVGVFDLDDTKKILTRARELGFGLKIHADEIEPMGGTELGVELGAASVDHLVAVSERGVEMLAKSDTVAVLLPGTSFFLDLGKFAPARRLIDSGAIVALATDFNPGSSPTTNMPLVMSIACTKMKMTSAETFAAATINAAKALKLEEKVGSITPGKQADLVIWNAENYRQIPYFYGENLVKMVLKRGEVVYKA